MMRTIDENFDFSKLTLEAVRNIRLECGDAFADKVLEKYHNWADKQIEEGRKEVEKEIKKEERL
jgi:hypothetical protein